MTKSEAATMARLAQRCREALALPNIASITINPAEMRVILEGIAPGSGDR